MYVFFCLSLILGVPSLLDPLARWAAATSDSWWGIVLHDRYLRSQATIWGSTALSAKGKSCLSGCGVVQPATCSTSGVYRTSPGRVAGLGYGVAQPLCHPELAGVQRSERRLWCAASAAPTLATLDRYSKFDPSNLGWPIRSPIWPPKLIWSSRSRHKPHAAIELLLPCHKGEG